MNIHFTVWNYDKDFSVIIPTKYSTLLEVEINVGLFNLCKICFLSSCLFLSPIKTVKVINSMNTMRKLSQQIQRISRNDCQEE